MTLLFSYVFLALFFSFFCSIAEAVLLSVSAGYIEVKIQDGHKSGKILKALKADINKPLAAILTLNTIAHTLGAAGAGAQASAVFGEAYLGVISAILTLLILIFSEIIPKTLGATYWRQLAPVTALLLSKLIWWLYPFVYMSEKLTRGLRSAPTLTGFDRSEFMAMAELSASEGQLAKQEYLIMKNILLLKDMRIKDAMTPRTVIFSLSHHLKVEEFFHKYDHIRFSRIPIYEVNREQIIGFILRSDILLAQARGNGGKLLHDYLRTMPTLLDTMSLSHAFNEFLQAKAHILLSVNEYGSVMGILTLEDVIETLLGLEIVDEGDKTEDMQKLARKLWKKRAAKMGIKVD
ncbi:MAG: HlyC/CorC family transporter [Colwellia sp.]|nr:HlyC/CorC family transporter [Colwellia sp.]